MSKDIKLIKDCTTDELMERMIAWKKWGGGRNGQEIVDEAIKYCGENHNDSYEDYQDRLRMFLVGDLFQYQITDTFTVGNVNVAQFGPFRKGMFAETGKMVSRFTLYTDDVDRPLTDRECVRGTIEEITALAQKHSDVIETGCESATVEFPSGKLAIANYFCTDSNKYDELPDDIQYKSEYSINTATGRMSTMQWLADNKNIAYGQVGNMTCYFYQVSPTKIVVTNCKYYYEEILDEDGEWTEVENRVQVPKGSVYLGSVCCSVWRFEMADKQTMIEKEFDLEQYKKDRNDLEIMDAEVEAGTYEIKCYYQQMSDKQLVEKFGFPMIAELNKVG